jgi:hypothetical protein
MYDGQQDYYNHDPNRKESFSHSLALVNDKMHSVAIQSPDGSRSVVLHFEIDETLAVLMFRIPKVVIPETAKYFIVAISSHWFLESYPMPMPISSTPLEIFQNVKLMMSAVHFC